MRACIAFLLGLAAGVASSVHYDGWGDACGDMDYTWWRFSWRGRRVEFHLEDAPGA